MLPTAVEGGARGDLWQDRLPSHRARTVLGSGPAGTRDHDQRSGEAEAGRWDMSSCPCSGLKACDSPQKHGAVVPKRYTPRYTLAEHPAGCTYNTILLETAIRRNRREIITLCARQNKFELLPMCVLLLFSGVRLEQRYGVSTSYLFAVGGAQEPRHRLPHVWGGRWLRQPDLCGELSTSSVQSSALFWGRTYLWGLSISTP